MPSQSARPIVSGRRSLSAVTKCQAHCIKRASLSSLTAVKKNLASVSGECCLMTDMKYQTHRVRRMFPVCRHEVLDPLCKEHVSWCFEPSQPQRITSGLSVRSMFSVCCYMDLDPLCQGDITEFPVCPRKSLRATMSGAFSCLPSRSVSPLCQVDITQFINCCQEGSGHCVRGMLSNDGHEVPDSSCEEDAPCLPPRSARPTV